MPLEEHELRTAEATATPPSGTIEQALAGIPALPADALILIPTRSFVLFPGTVLPVTLGRQRSIAAAQAAIRLNRPSAWCCSAIRRPRTRSRSTCTGWAPRPTCCAM